MSLGEYMRQLRGGRSQVQVAEALGHVRGVTQSTISRLEADEWHPDSGQMEHLLKVLGATEQQARIARQLAEAEALRSVAM